MFGKINQRGKIWKKRKGEQSFLCMKHHSDLIHIPVKLHESLTVTELWCVQEFWKN